MESNYWGGVCLCKYVSELDLETNRQYVNEKTIINMLDEKSDNKLT